MGWKTLKDKMQITHNVDVVGDTFVIGSGYLPKLATIDMLTGVAKSDNDFPNFLREHYPAVADAEPSELLALIQAEDTFSASIPVYSYKGSTILESKCETPGYPNNTHDGVLMYENAHSTDKAEVVRWAKDNARRHASGMQQYLDRMEAEMGDAKKELAKAEQWVEELAAQFPDSPGEAPSRAKSESLLSRGIKLLDVEYSNTTLAVFIILGICANVFDGMHPEAGEGFMLPYNLLIGAFDGLGFFSTIVVTNRLLMTHSRLLGAVGVFVAIVVCSYGVQLLQLAGIEPKGDTSIYGDAISMIMGGVVFGFVLNIVDRLVHAQEQRSDIKGTK